MLFSEATTQTRFGRFASRHREKPTAATRKQMGTVTNRIFFTVRGMVVSVQHRVFFLSDALAGRYSVSRPAKRRLAALFPVYIVIIPVRGPPTPRAPRERR